MKPSRTLLIFFIVFCTNINVNCQSPSLHEIGARIKAGDKQALFMIASYFDSSREIAEYSGQEVFYYTKSNIAKRIVKDNCLFTADEINMTDSTPAAEFDSFLMRNKTNIQFSALANAFLITPLVNRPVRFEMRPLSKKRQAELQDMRVDLLKADWVRQRKIDRLVKQKDPLALLEIAAEYFKRRWTDDYYAFDGPQFTALIQMLTGVEIGFEDGTREISWRYSDDFVSDSRLNLLILFSKYYQQYTWDSSKSVFVNPSNKVRQLYAEDTLFGDLMNSNDSIALNAFIRLSTGDVKRVATMADGYLRHHEDLKDNCLLPAWPFPILKQMAVLTDYCKSNGIDYYGSTDLRKKIDSLRGDLSFKERFRLENDLIDKLSFNEVTAIEYWALVYERSWGLAFSAGRILDKFYSKNWHDFIHDKRSLDCYLKKATLFMRAGINNYLVKFKNSPDSILAILKAYPTTDFDIQIQIKLILSHNKVTARASPNNVAQRTGWTEDVIYVADSLQKQFDELFSKKFFSSMEREYAINELVSKISYTQIAIALNNINKCHFRDSRDKDLMLVAKDGMCVDTRQSTGKKYSFLETDFGLYLCGDFGDSLVRSAFLERYSKLSEYDLYAFYLDDAGVFYKKQDGKLDYDKIYELLKYDVVTPFAGGGGGSNQDGEVFSLVKLLELTFKTTLGFPPKRCNCAGVWYCDCADRANAWMRYIEDHKLLNYLHPEPVSFRNE